MVRILFVPRQLIKMIPERSIEISEEYSFEYIFVCCVGRELLKQHTLKLHKRTLDGPRPSMCTVCEKTIAIASDMRKHLVIHDRESVEEPNILDTAVLTECQSS